MPVEIGTGRHLNFDSNNSGRQSFVASSPIDILERIQGNQGEPKSIYASTGSNRRLSNSGPSCDAACIGGLIAGAVIAAALFAYGISLFLRSMSGGKNESQQPYTLRADVLPASEVPRWITVAPIAVESQPADSKPADSKPEPAWTGQFGEAIRPRLPSRSLRRPSFTLAHDQATGLPVWNPDGDLPQQPWRPAPSQPATGPAMLAEAWSPAFSQPAVSFSPPPPLYYVADGFGGALLRPATPVARWAGDEQPTLQYAVAGISPAPLSAWPPQQQPTSWMHVTTPR